MRSDILEILQLLKRKNLRYSLLTNGTLIDNEKARKLVNLDPESIGISLDGPEKVHEMIRGPGTFNKTVKGIELLKRNGYSRVKINCSISRMNFESLEYLVDIANDLGVTLQYQHLMFTEKRRDNEHRKMIKKYFDFDSEDRISGSPHEMQKVNVDTLIEQITKIKNLHSGIKFKPDLSLTEIKKYYLDLKDYTHAKYCLYPWNVARINPQGEVPYCIMGYTAGTLLDSSFADVWNSENMQYFRRVLKEVKLFPNCVRCGKI